MGLYSKGRATKMALVAGNSADGRLKTKSQYIKESKLVEVSGLLHCNPVNSNHLLLNGLSSKIVLHQQRDSFVLMADDASRGCRVRVIEVQLSI